MQRRREQTQNGVMHAKNSVGKTDSHRTMECRNVTERFVADDVGSSMY